MTKALKLGLVFWACTCALFHSQVWSATQGHHDFELIGDNEYRTSGPDPYLIVTDDFGVEAIRKDDTPIGLYLEFLVYPHTDLLSPSLGIFWSSANQSFSQSRLVNIPISEGSNQIFLPLSLFAQHINQVRIDLEKCDCTIRFSKLTKNESSQLSKAFIPAAVKRMLQTGGGRPIAVSDWSGVELEKNAEGNFKFAGWDPRIVNSTAFNAHIDRYAGFYLDFSYDFDRPVQSYELFWYLDGLKSNSRRSAHFTQSTNGVTRRQIYIPFEGIHSKRNLNHLRFDFEACETCTFKLHESRLVGHLEKRQYHRFRPARLYYVHTEPMPAGKLKQAVFEKLLVDKGFWLFYILLITGLIIAFYRRYLR